MKDKVILITGTSKGIGRQLAEYYSKSNQVFGLSRTGTGPQETKSLTCDLRDPKSIQDSVKKIIEEAGRIDIVIQNAAVLKSSPLALLSHEDIENMIETNLLGVIYLTKEVLRPMMKAKSGRIINIISMSHLVAAVGDSVYAASKAAVETFAKIANKEAHSFGITINNLGISATPTGMLDQIVKNQPDRVRQVIPHGDYTNLENITATLDYFADPRCTDIGGQTIYLGGI